MIGSNPVLHPPRRGRVQSDDKEGIKLAASPGRNAYEKSGTRNLSVRIVAFRRARLPLLDGREVHTLELLQSRMDRHRTNGWDSGRARTGSRAGSLASSGTEETVTTAFGFVPRRSDGILPAVPQDKWCPGRRRGHWGSYPIVGDLPPPSAHGIMR